MDLLNPVPLEGTPSCIDTDAQRVNFAELSEDQYQTLQGDSTVRIESSEKMNQDPVQHETVPQPTQTLDSEESPLEPERLAPTASKSSPKQNSLASREYLTDEQCRRIQEILDPDSIRIQKFWEIESQPELIRLYMAGRSYPEIESAMKPKLHWS
jgi:hypothetical protein